MTAPSRRTDQPAGTPVAGVDHVGGEQGELRGYARGDGREELGTLPVVPARLDTSEMAEVTERR